MNQDSGSWNLAATVDRCARLGRTGWIGKRHMTWRRAFAQPQLRMDSRNMDWLRGGLATDRGAKEALPTVALSASRRSAAASMQAHLPMVSARHQPETHPRIIWHVACCTRFETQCALLRVKAIAQTHQSSPSPASTAAFEQSQRLILRYDVFIVASRPRALKKHPRHAPPQQPAMCARSGPGPHLQHEAQDSTANPSATAPVKQQG